MNRYLFMIGLVSLCIYGLEELKKNNEPNKNDKLFRIIYIFIIIGTVVYFMGYEVGKMTAHLNM